MLNKIKTHIISLIIVLCVLVLSSMFNEIIISKFKFFPLGLITQLFFILFSLLLIKYFKYQINYQISISKLIKVVPVTFLSIFGILFLLDLVIITESESDSFLNMPVKNLLTVLFINCFGEEFLFKGFLQNYYSKFRNIKFKIFKINISYPVLISGLLFGIMHFAIITTGVIFLSALKVVLSAIAVGLITGYYYEKYSSLSIAIIIHFISNLTSLIYSLTLG